MKRLDQPVSLRKLQFFDVTACTVAAVGDASSAETVSTEVDLRPPEDELADVDGDTRLLQFVQHGAKTLVVLLQRLTGDEDDVEVVATSFHSSQQVVQQLMAR